MFSDVAHFSQLYHSVWPAMTVIQVTDVDASGGGGGVDPASNGGGPVMTSGTWNYGVNFGGPTKSSWTSGKDTDRGFYGTRHEGMFGNSYVGDSAYSTSYGGIGTTVSASVTMCQNNATGTHPTWCQ